MPHLSVAAGSGQRYSSRIVDIPFSVLRQACALLDAAQPAEALETITPFRASDSRLVKGIGLVAEGLLAESSGNPEEALACFEESWRLGITIPSLLTQQQRFFKRQGVAHEAFVSASLAQQLRADAISEFWTELPVAWRSRFAPSTAVRMFFAARPELYRMQPAKAALAQTLRITGAALVLSQMIGPSAQWRLLKLPLASLHEFALRQGKNFQEVLAPRPVTMQAPPVFNGLQIPILAGRSRSVYCCELDDIVVSSKSSFLLAQDCVLMDYQGAELSTMPLNFDADPIVVAGDATMLSILDRREESRLTAMPEAFSLVGVHSYDYGHWVHELMFKLWIARQGRPQFANVPLLVDEKMPAQHRETLQFFAPENPLVTLKPGESVRVKRLLVCSKISYMPSGVRPGTCWAPEEEISDGEAVAGIVEQLQPQLATLDTPESGRSIYLQRNDTLRRRMLNRPAVESWFKARGFEIVNLADLGFVDQLRLLRSARCVVGPDGASFYGLLFARPGLRAGILSEPTLIAYEWLGEVLRQLGHKLLLLPGFRELENRDYANQGDFSMDIAQLPAFLERLRSL